MSLEYSVSFQGYGNRKQEEGKLMIVIKTGHSCQGDGFCVRIARIVQFAMFSLFHFAHSYKRTSTYKWIYCKQATR